MRDVNDVVHFIHMPRVGTPFLEKTDRQAALLSTESGHHSLFLDFEGAVWRNKKMVYEQYVITPFNISPGILQAKLFDSSDTYIIYTDFDDIVWTTKVWGEPQQVMIRKDSELAPLRGKAVSIGIDSYVSEIPAYAVIDLDSNLWTWGDNNLGSLGLGIPGERGDIVEEPTQVPNHLVSEVLVSGASMYFIDMNQQLWGAGAATSTRSYKDGYSSVPIKLFDRPIRKIAGSGAVIDTKNNLYLQHSVYSWQKVDNLQVFDAAIYRFLTVNAVSQDPLSDFVSRELQAEYPFELPYSVSEYTPKIDYKV
jgi:hypothetical protein